MWHEKIILWICFPLPSALDLTVFMHPSTCSFIYQQLVECLLGNTGHTVRNLIVGGFNLRLVPLLVERYERRDEDSRRLFQPILHLLSLCPFHTLIFNTSVSSNTLLLSIWNAFSFSLLLLNSYSLQFSPESSLSQGRFPDLPGQFLLFSTCPGLSVSTM